LSKLQNLLASLLSVSLLTFSVHAQEAWTPAQEEVLEAMEQLSAATAPGGDGADAYGALLAEDFSRWTIGSEKLNRKAAWVAAVREWFDDGWRVTDRETQVLEIHLRGDIAYTRRIVKETYQGPDGESSVSSAARAEVWVHEEAGWLLSRVDVHPMEN
jgi:ketosteroid isomerase-like protein